MLFYVLYFLISLSVFISAAFAETTDNKPPAMGNFSLPFSQQPASFLSFGQNTLGKGQTQLYLFADDYAGNKQNYIDLAPGIVYGATDNLSLYFATPYAVNYQQENNQSSGFEDVLLQMEYIFLSKNTKHYSETATLVLNTTFPTGSSTKNPPTGFGAQTFFFGGTFNRMYTDWLYFFSPGLLIPTSSHGTQFGNDFLYQFGIGKNISYEKSKYILNWLLELNGTYYQKDTINGETDPNSGGNIIYAIPSLWFSTQHFIFQSGIGWPVTQQWNGDQLKRTYLLAVNLGWTF